ncbi:HAD family hydrolase [Vaginisenegalia massiliensis]|uniref:HAD family hydrolase n=1 Tax=Vaginisenegalia massiliensis TaxID=2058294 RepID=UPI0013DE47DE|nr:HAD family hydrolase [Vaginisenegalia massiliensis]
MIKLIIFDKDGTLIHFPNRLTQEADDIINEVSIRINRPISKASIKHLFQRLRFFGLKGLTQPQVSHGIEHLRRLPGGASLANRLHQKIGQLVLKSHQSSSQMIDGVENVLLALKHLGYQLAIISADDLLATHAFLEKYHIESLFDVVVTSDLLPQQKPDPALINYVLNQLDLPANQAIMVGDTQPDIILGQNAGLAYTIGVLSGSGNHEDLAEADLIIESVAQLFTHDQLKLFKP